MKKISLKEFVELGFLQELNRLFLHPRGLAMAVTRLENGDCFFDCILDVRDDIEGWAFDKIDTQKADNVELEFRKHLKARNKLWNTKKGIQPINNAIKSSTD